MSFPEPKPGLVIRYSCLWEREALSGRDEGFMRELSRRLEARRKIKKMRSVARTV